MKRKIIALSFILIAVIVFLIFSLSQTEIRKYRKDDTLKIVEGVVYSLDESGEAYYVKDYFATDYLAETATDIIIVSEIDGIPVKGIRPDYLFYESYDNVERITVPEGIEYIGEEAFSSLGGIVKIELPDSVIKIEKGAFKNMACLETVTLPSGVTEISEEMFRYCSGLRTVYVTGETERIGDCAFEGCKNLTSFELDDNLRSLGDAAFKWSGLTSVYVPSGVIFGGREGTQSLFEGCTELKKAEFENREDEDFLLGEGFFSGCTSLEEVVLPQAKEIYVSAFAFYGCESLKSLVSTESISLIGTKAFYGCGLDEINLSADVVFKDYGKETASTSAFENCTGLNKVVFKKSEKTERFILPEKTFKGCTALKRVILPVTEKETVIGERAFSGCSRLVGVYNTAKVTEIGEAAFYECTSLDNFTVPEKVTVLRAKTFYGCKRLKEIYLHGKISGIENDVFGECQKLRAVCCEGTEKEYEQIKKAGDFKKLSDRIKYESEYHPVLDSIEVNVGKTSATLSWAVDDGADCYRLYTWEDSKLKKIADTEQTEFTFKDLIPGEEYTFFVRAITYKDGKKIKDPQKECVIIVAGKE